MSRLDRRDFLGAASVAIGGTALAWNVPSVEGQTSGSGFETLTWQQYQFDARNTGHPDTAGPNAALTPAWRFDEGGNLGVVSAPAMADGTMYFTSIAGEMAQYEDVTYISRAGGYVHAVDVETGTEQWRVETSGDRSAPALEDGAVIVNRGDLLALEADTGEKRWEASNSFQADAPTVADGTVYCLDVGGGVRALSVEDGSEQWSNEPSMLGGPESMATPAVSDGTVFVNVHAGSGLSLLLAFDADTGEERWRAQFTSGGHFPPTVVDGTVYFAAYEGGEGEYLLAYDATDGTEQWRVLHDLRGGGAGYADGTLYLPEGDGLVARDAETGELVWRIEPSSVQFAHAPVVANGVVYAGTDGGGIYTIDAASGELLGQFVPDTGLAGDEPPAVVDGRVYTGFYSQETLDDVGQGLYAIETGEEAAASAEPTVDFTTSPDRKLREMPVTFEEGADELGDVDEGSAQYRWEFGDGNETTTESSTVEHRYSESGTYEVTLTVANSYGWTVSTTGTVEVADETYEPPEAVITTDPPNAEEGTTDADSVVLQATESEGGTRPIERYAWDINRDGEFEQEGETIEVHTAYCGEFPYALQVTDSLGVTATAEIVITTA